MVKVITLKRLDAFLASRWLQDFIHADSVDLDSPTKHESDDGGTRTSVPLYRLASPLKSPPRPYPLIFSHSTFCRVTGNCLLKDLKLVSLKATKVRLTSSWYCFSMAATLRTILAPSVPSTATDWIFLAVVNATFPSS